MKETTRSRLSLALKILVSAGILALLARKIDFAAVGAAMAEVSGAAIAGVLLVMIVQQIAVGGRWVLIMRVLAVPLELGAAVPVVYVCTLFNQFLPSYIGGDGYRIYWLHREGAPLARSVRGVLIDRVSALIALVLMLGVTMPLVARLLPDPLIQAGFWIIFAAGLAGTAGFLFFDLLPLPAFLRPYVGQVAELSADARAVLLGSGRGAAIALLALLVHLLTGVAIFTMAGGLGIPIGLSDSLLLVAPIAFAAALPISVSGWGVREGTIVAILSLLGIPKEPTLALSLLLGLCALANGLLGLLPLLFGGARYLPANRTVEEQEARSR